MPVVDSLNLNISVSTAFFHGFMSLSPTRLFLPLISNLKRLLEGLVTLIYIYFFSISACSTTNNAALTSAKSILELRAQESEKKKKLY